MEEIFTLVNLYSKPLTWVTVILGISAVISFLFYLFDIKGFFSWVIKKHKESKDFKNSLRLLKAGDYFITQIIQVGGNNSDLYSMRVFRNEEGGYYLNPPRKFVSISFTRGGDIMNVSPTYFTKYYGFAIESVSKDQSEWKPETPYMVPLPIPEIRNEWFVKFVKFEEWPLSFDLPPREPSIVGRFFIKHLPYAHAIFTGAHRRM